jgi:RNA polymerase sigma-70 factor (ECF subfamily)
MHEATLMFEIPRVVSDTFDQLVGQRENQVLRVAYRILGNWADSEDVAQEAFLRLHRHGLSFADERVLMAWLIRVTVNLCLDRVRAARRSGALLEMQPDEIRSYEMPADALLLLEERKRRLMAALDLLPVKERAALVLREIEGLPT